MIISSPPVRRRDVRLRARRRARARSLVAGTVIMAGAMLLGLTAAGGTYALLSANAQGPGATITAGSFDIRVNNQASAVLQPVVVTPNTPAVRPFTVSSAGDVPSVLSAQIVATSSQAITTNTQARITPVANAAACVVGLGGALADLNGYTLPTLDRLTQTQTKTYCLEVRLKPGTPVAQSGQGVAFRLTVTGTQEAR